MGIFSRLFGNKTPNTAKSYFFICSGNPSLISSHYELFRVGALAYKGVAGLYSASISAVNAREKEAGKTSLPFAGHSYLGSKAEPMAHVHEVLQRLGVSANTEIHVAFVSVDQTGVSWVQKVYAELLGQAVSQGILPYRMFVTNDETAAQFLLDSFEKRS